MDNIRGVARRSSVMDGINMVPRHLNTKRSAPTLTSHKFVPLVLPARQESIPEVSSWRAEYLRAGAISRAGRISPLERSTTPMSMTDCQSATASEFSERSMGSSEMAHGGLNPMNGVAEADLEKHRHAERGQPGSSGPASASSTPHITPMAEKGEEEAMVSFGNSKDGVKARNPTPSLSILPPVSPSELTASSRHLSISTSLVAQSTTSDAASIGTNDTLSLTPVIKTPTVPQFTSHSHQNLATPIIDRRSTLRPSSSSSCMLPLSPPPLGPLPSLPDLPSPFSASFPSSRKGSFVSDRAESDRTPSSLVDPKSVKDRHIPGAPLSPSRSFAWGALGQGTSASGGGSGSPQSKGTALATPRPVMGRKGSTGTDNGQQLKVTSPPVNETTRRMTTNPWSEEEAKTLSMMLDELESYDQDARTSPSYQAMAAIFPLGLEAERERLKTEGYSPTPSNGLTRRADDGARQRESVQKREIDRGRDDKEAAISPPHPPPKKKTLYMMDDAAGSLSALGIALFPNPPTLSSTTMRMSPGSAPATKTSFDIREMEHLGNENDRPDLAHRESSDKTITGHHHGPPHVRTLRKHPFSSVQGLRDLAASNVRSSNQANNQSISTSRSQPVNQVTSRNSPLRGSHMNSPIFHPTSMTSSASKINGPNPLALPPRDQHQLSSSSEEEDGKETETDRKLRLLEEQLEAEKEERAKASVEALTLRLENRQARRKIRE